MWQKNTLLIPTSTNKKHLQNEHRITIGWNKRNHTYSTAFFLYSSEIEILHTNEDILKNSVVKRYVFFPLSLNIEIFYSRTSNLHKLVSQWNRKTFFFLFWFHFILWIYIVSFGESVTLFCCSNCCLLDQLSDGLNFKLFSERNEKDNCLLVLSQSDFMCTGHKIAFSFQNSVNGSTTRISYFKKLTKHKNCFFRYSQNHSFDGISMRKDQRSFSDKYFSSELMYFFS